MQILPSLHLTYCTNIHPGRGWDDVRANLERIAPRLKAALSPAAPFGLGLRLSAVEARQLLEGDRLEQFRSFLNREGLYVALINGFPYGPFHGEPVKTEVYAPDWRDPARLAYTLDLVTILSRLAPPDIDGGISTSPLSYKAWMASAGRRDWERIVEHLIVVLERLIEVRQTTGKWLHLDIEPEPDCSLENTDETIAFFEDWLRPAALARLTSRFGWNADEALTHIHDHLAVCFDCCHVAVEFENPQTAIQRLAAAGIRVGRVQLSSALRLDLPADAAAASDMATRLRPFADATYLHQTVEQRSGA